MSGFEKILDTGICNMRRQDREILSGYVAGDAGEVAKNGTGALIVYPFEYGWTVSTSGMLDGEADRRHRVERMREEGYSEAFVNLMVHAAENGAVLVRFDRDLEALPGFPEFDHDTDEEISEGTPPSP